MVCSAVLCVSAQASPDLRASVAWQTSENSANTIWYSFFEKQRWSKPESVYSSKSQLSSVVLTSLTSKTKILFWGEKVKSKTRIFYRTFDVSSESKITLGAVRSLSVGCNTCLAIFPIIETDGVLRLVWSDTKAGLDDVFTARYDGESWFAIQKVNEANDVPDILPVARIGMDGETIVEWKSYSRVAGRYLKAQKNFESSFQNNENKQYFSDITANQIPRLSNLPYNSRLFYHLPDNKFQQNIPINGSKIK